MALLNPSPLTGEDGLQGQVRVFSLDPNGADGRGWPFRARFGTAKPKAKSGEGVLP